MTPRNEKKPRASNLEAQLENEIETEDGAGVDSRSKWVAPVVDRTPPLWVTIVFLSACIAAIVVAAIVTLVTRDYVPLAVVWAIVGPIIGRMTNIFFPGGT